jgi:ElaB/YqjD/DUF883 family membrane-anchored ribosome-binding protein
MVLQTVQINAGPENKKEDPMSQTVVERTAGHIAESAHQASRAASAVADAIGDGVGVVKRAAKQGGDAAEELLADATQRVQRHPGLAVAATFATGFTLGALVAWTIKRK